VLIFSRASFHPADVVTRDAAEPGVPSNDVSRPRSRVASHDEMDRLLRARRQDVVKAVAARAGRAPAADLGPRRPSCGALDEIIIHTSYSPKSRDLARHRRNFVGKQCDWLARAE